MKHTNRKDHEFYKNICVLSYPYTLKSRVPTGQILAVALHKAIHAFQGFFDAFQAGGVGAANVTFAAVAKGAARNDGDTLFQQQAFAELKQ